MRVDSEIVFAAVAAQRREIADVMDGLDEKQLATPSLCSGWDIKTVAAHVVSVFADSFWVFMTTAARHASMARAIDVLARQRASSSVTEIADTLRRRADHPLSPPLFGPLDPLADILVHTGDIYIPLDLPFHPDPQHAALALDFLSGPWPFGFVPAGRLRGLSLHATDAGRTWRTGAQIRGTARALMMCVAGRDVLADELDGPGLAVLRQRSGW
ncbi:MAG TPA: maleylpyruvate isomerase family mycothiol-dependent enzyme [Mycobacterium sp.]